MATTLSDFWPALCPRLPAAWDTEDNRRNLAEITARMARIPRVAMECALGDAVPTLDVQQHPPQRPRGGRPSRLPRAAGEGDADGSGPWARLRRFCTAWADPSTSLHEGIGEIFLKYDLGASAGGALMPSLFLALGDAGTAPAVRDQVAVDALRLLLPASWPPGLREHLERCIGACPQGAFVGYLGVMLGRGAPGIRVNVKRLPAGELGTYLDAVGWRGLAAAAERWGEWAYDRFDRVTACLDVGAAVLPHLGLECVLAAQPDREPRWGVLLEELVGAGLCRAGNGAALLSVPGVLRPPDHPAGWPAAWIAATLGGPAERFSTTERLLSHLKLTVSEQGTVLKGYWGAGHVWRTASPPDQGGARPGSGPLPEATAAAVDEALAAATGFLAGAQAQHRPLVRLPPARRPERRVGDRLCRRQPGRRAVRAGAAGGGTGVASAAGPHRDEPGWGYNRVTPADADSTAWALRLAAALGAGGGRVDEARHFLHGHLLPDGGVTAYAAGDPIRRFTQLPEDASLAGWQASHVCVTAAAGPVVGASVESYLTGVQSPSGHWTGYRWWDDEYATALAAQARAAEWAEGRVGASGAIFTKVGQPSPWATAWGVRVLCLGTTAAARAATARALRFLLGAQRPDGSWPSSARLRVPLPARLDAGEQGRTITAVDQERVFTTAAVAAALTIARTT